MTNQDLRQLCNREELAAALRPLFPHLLPSDSALSPTRGGRAAARQVLAQVKPGRYERSRNYLDGDVTRLSAYLRHGVLTLAEVRDSALQQVSTPREAGKLINEYAWRDYWQRLYTQMGEGIWQDREPYRTGFRATDYQQTLPEDIKQGATTLTCMDSFANQLEATGYLHNHARMWMAAYVVHWRRTQWQAGAAWFLEDLVDGDPASNNLSWQWVASTFSSKPYIFNRENLERYTAGVYCKSCPHAQAHTCPFEQDYEGLEQTLFPRLKDQAGSAEMPTPPRPFPSAQVSEPRANTAGKPLLWVHTDSLNPDSPMVRDHADSPAVFVWDVEWLTKSHIALKRIVFLAECLQEMPGTVELRVGDPAREVLAYAQASGAKFLLAQRTPDPRLLAAAAQLQKSLPVVWYDPPAFAQSSKTFDLKRFSRYWQRAQDSAMQTTRA
ncbi:MAG: FAD-binding domain-containing protein [Janthinobacterium lividum]